MASSAEAYLKLKAETAELLNDVGEALASLLDAPDNHPHHIDLTQQLGAFFGCYYKLRKRLERDALSVAVLALTKSGKSTLINAFLANEVLPVNNVPETARICRIKHLPAASCPEPVLELSMSAHSGASRTPSLASAGSCALDSSSSLGSSPSSTADGGGGCVPAGFTARSCSMDSSREDAVTEVLVGAGAIREHLQQLNRDVRAREHLRNDEKILNISAPLVVLDSTAATAAAAGASSSSPAADLSGIQLCLLDTPGPNEAGEEGLKYQVERLLGRVDAAIYLLDYTKLKTAEEAGVLGRLRDVNPTLVRRLCSRLFFAVNKMDQADESCGLDDEETRAYVAEIVTQQLNCPDFKLHPDQVLLLSARDALLSRLILSGRSDAANTQRFCRIAFGAYNPRPRARNNTPAPNALPGSGGRSLEECRAAAAGLLEGSGVPELEERVLGYLCEAAAGVKLTAMLDDTGRLLAEVSNVSSSCRAALAASSSALAAKTSSLQTQLDATLGSFDSIMEGTAELQVEVTDELRAHLGNLRTRLFQYICNALDADTLRLHQTAAGAAAAAEDASAAGDTHGPADPPSGGNSSSRRHHHHRRHGCCHSRRRHGSSSNAAGGSNGGSSSSHFYTSCGETFSSGGGFGGGAGGAAFAAADIFTGFMPGGPAAAAAAAAAAHFAGFGGSNAGSGGSSGGGRSIPVQTGSSSRSVPVHHSSSSGLGSSGSSGGGWWGLRQRFLHLFGRAGGGKSESKDELSSALMDLSEDLMAQIQAEVAEAWHVMECATNDRAARLTATLNGHIQQLSAQLEGAVNEALQIQLEPVSLRLAAPDAVQFHADLTDLMEKGIRAEQSRHVRTGERTDFVMEARRGACRLTQYYVQVPRRRRIVETYTATTYSLAPEAVLEHFMGVVDEAIGATEAQLPGYVREYIRRQVEQARSKVEQYGSRYVESLSAALEAASAGADARQSALDQVTGYCDALDTLRGRLTALQSKAELLVPHNTASGCGLFEQCVYEEEEGQEDEEEGLEQQGLEQQGHEPTTAAADSADAYADAADTAGSAAAVAAAAAEGPFAEAAAAAAAAAAAEAAEAAAEEDKEGAGCDDRLAGLGAVLGGSSEAPHLLDALTEPTPAAAAAAADDATAAVAAAEELLQQEPAEADDTSAAAAAAAAVPAAAAGGAAAVAAMGSSSLFAASFEALSSWIGHSSSSKDGSSTAAAAADGMEPTSAQQQDSVAEQREQGEEEAAAADSSDTAVEEDSPAMEPAAAAAAAAGETEAVEAEGDEGWTPDSLDMPPLLDVPDETTHQADSSSSTPDDPAPADPAPAGGDSPAATAAPAAAGSVDGGGSSRRSSSARGVSDAETAVSDSFSLVSAAATESSAFSGMTAGTAFTLASGSSSSGLSRLQEHLADAVLAGAGSSGGTAAAAAAGGDGVCGAADADGTGAASDAADAAADAEECRAAVAAAADDDAAAAAAAAPAAAPAAEEAAAATEAPEGMETEAAQEVTEAAATKEQQAEDTAAAAAAAAAAPAPAVGPEGSMYASMYGSGLLLSADDVAGALQMSALPLDAGSNTTDTTSAAAAAGTAADKVLPAGAADIDTRVAATTAAPAAPAPAPPAPAAAAPAPAAAGEAWEGDASLYASIIAHSEDPEQQPGSPFNFGESFAAALSAAGLDSLSGPSPPSGSPRDSGSEEWQIVEADIEGAAAPQGVAEGAGSTSQGASGSAAGEGAASSSSGGAPLGRRSWLGGRAK